VCMCAQAYAGRVREDIDHRALQPAAWRVDDYLDLDDSKVSCVLASWLNFLQPRMNQSKRHLMGNRNMAVSRITQAAQLDDLRGHTLVFAKTGVSSMDRKDDVDDLVVRHLTQPPPRSLNASCQGICSRLRLSAHNALPQPCGVEEQLM